MELGPTPGPDASPADDLRRPDDLVGVGDRALDDASSAARTSQTRPRSRYHARSKPADGRVMRREVLGVPQQHRRPDPAVRPGLVEPDPVRRRAAVRLAVAHRLRPGQGRRAARGRRARCPRSGRSGGPAAPRTIARRRRSPARPTAAPPRPRRATRASSSWCRTSALMPRAPHLQSYASAAPGRSTVTSYGWISAATPSNRIRRSRLTASGADAACEQPGGDLLDDRAADLAADLLAAVGDLQRGGQDRLARRARRRHRPPARTASGTSPASRRRRSSRRS